LAVTGAVAPEAHWPKGPLRSGQVLLLTRAIGSGVLFAAALAGQAQPQWIDTALEVMQQSQAPLVELLARHGCQACTDITGFGLLGHLGEMLGPDQRVELDPLAIPSLPGSLVLLEQGLASSLAPANAQALQLLEPGAAVRLAAPASAALLQLWIDPQTCGPLLVALPADRAEGALASLRAAGFHQAAVIGRVL
jgi:selenide,water dikinase